MKTKKFQKGLVLKKETISTLTPDVISLSDEEKGKLKGGIGTCTYCSQIFICDGYCFSLNTKCPSICF